MAKRSAALQKTIDSLNNLLSLKTLYLYNNEGTMVRVDSSSELAKNYKDGICHALEVLLHNSNSYKGYMFLNVEEREDLRFDRKYF